jgi:hypothetical protein
MRTTLDLEDALLRAARKLAADRGTTLTAVIEQALRQHLMQAAKPARPFRLRLLIKKGRLHPGVDVADRDSLYDRMQAPSDRG